MSQPSTLNLPPPVRVIGQSSASGGPSITPPAAQIGRTPGSISRTRNARTVPTPARTRTQNRTPAPVPQTPGPSSAPAGAPATQTPGPSQGAPGAPNDNRPGAPAPTGPVRSNASQSAPAPSPPQQNPDFRYPAPEPPEEYPQLEPSICDVLKTRNETDVYHTHLCNYAIRILKGGNAEIMPKCVLDVLAANISPTKKFNLCDSCSQHNKGLDSIADNNKLVLNWPVMRGTSSATTLVWVADTGAKFHTKQCGSVTNENSRMSRMTQAAAKAQGYVECDNCRTGWHQ